MEDRRKLELDPYHRFTKAEWAQYRDGEPMTLTAADIEQYSALTGDTNPIHTDKAFAKKTMFGEPIAQGMLSASVLSACIGSRLPVGTA